MLAGSCGLHQLMRSVDTVMSRDPVRLPQERLAEAYKYLPHNFPPREWTEAERDALRTAALNIVQVHSLPLLATATLVSPLSASKCVSPFSVSCAAIPLNNVTAVV